MSLSVAQETAPALTTWLTDWLWLPDCQLPANWQLLLTGPDVRHLHASAASLSFVVSYVQLVAIFWLQLAPHLHLQQRHKGFEYKRRQWHFGVVIYIYLFNSEQLITEIGPDSWSSSHFGMRRMISLACGGERQEAAGGSQVGSRHTLN